MNKRRFLHIESDIMNNILKIISQAFFSFSGKVYLIILGFWFKFYLSANLEEAAYSLGVFALGMTIIDVISPFASLGLGGTAIRFIPKWKVEGKVKSISSFVTTSTLITVMFSGLFFVVTIWQKDFVLQYFSDGEREMKTLSMLLPVFLIMMVVKNVSELFIQVLRGFQEVKKSTIITSFVGVTVKVLLVVILITVGWDLEGYVYGEFIASIILLLILGVYLGKSLGFRLQADRDWIDKGVLSYAGTVLLFSVLSMITVNLDRILLGHLSISDLGVYYIAFSFVPFLSIVLTSVNSIFAPVISQVWSEGSMIELQRLYQFFTKWILLLTLPMVYVMVSFSEELLLLFGKEFIGGAQVLVILSVAHLVNVSFGSVGMLLQMTGQHLQVLRISVINTIVSAVSMFILIPKYGLKGAAIAAALGIILNNILSYLVMYNKFKFIPYQKKSWKLILSSFISVLCLKQLFSWIPFSGEGFVSLLVIGLITLVVFLLSARVICFSKEDEEVFNQLKRKLIK